MTIRTIPTTAHEADLILEGKRGFIIRGDKDFYKPCDLIQFRVTASQRTVYHKIEKASFVVTEVLDSSTAPIERGYQLIGVRRLK